MFEISIQCSELNQGKIGHHPTWGMFYFHPLACFMKLYLLRGSAFSLKVGGLIVNFQFRVGSHMVPSPKPQVT